MNSKSKEPIVYEAQANKPFHFLLMPDDLKIIAFIQSRFPKLSGKQAGGKRNIAVRIRLCMRIFYQLSISADKVRKLNAEYEAAHPDCQQITIGED